MPAAPEACEVEYTGLALSEMLSKGRASDL
jgi:hypothetical protein